MAAPQGRHGEELQCGMDSLSIFNAQVPDDVGAFACRRVRPGIRRLEPRRVGYPMKRALPCLPCVRSEGFNGSRRRPKTARLWVVVRTDNYADISTYCGAQCGLLFRAAAFLHVSAQSRRRRRERTMKLSPCKCDPQHFHRVSRRWWMRLVPMRRLFQCSKCQAFLFLRSAAARSGRVA